MPAKNTYKRGERFRARDANMLANFCNTLEFVGGRIERTADFVRCKIVPLATETSADGEYSFQVRKEADDTVTVASGYCQYKDYDEEFKEGVELTCTESGSVFIMLNIMTGEWGNPTYSSVTPDDDDIYEYYRIADVTVTSGVITKIIQRRGHDLYESGV